jgi:hypothetical protein
MEEPFCNQAKAYRTGTAMEASLDAVIIYEQLKEAIESAEGSLNEDERLLVLWYRPADTPILVENVGYSSQAFLVLSGKDTAAIESIALVNVNLLQVVLQIVRREPGEDYEHVSFMGHSLRPT